MADENSASDRIEDARGNLTAMYAASQRGSSSDHHFDIALLAESNLAIASALLEVAAAVRERRD